MYTKFYQNRQGLVEDMTKNILVSYQLRNLRIDLLGSICCISHIGL